VNPLDFGKNGPVLDNVLVRCQKDLELVHAKLCLKPATLSGVAFVGDHADTRSPLGELAAPIRHSRQRDDDKIGPALPLGFDEESNERNRLDGFSETLRIFQKVFATKKTARTISSAKMPLSLLLYKLTIHCKPLS